MKRVIVHNIGNISYSDALSAQEEFVDEVISGGDSAHLMILEHSPPVITLGRRAKLEHLLISEEQLKEKGFDLFESSRGGDITFHGPGQLVAYPIIRIDKNNGVRQHMRNLEQSVIDLLADLDINGERKEGFPGVWTSAGKVSAVGVAVKRWVTYHGLSLNVAPDTSGFDAIVPCGLGGIAVTSISELSGESTSVDEIAPRLAEKLCRTLGFSDDSIEYA